VVYGDVSDLQYRDQDIRLMVDPVPMTDPKAHLEYIHERLEANYDFTFSLTDE
jgi:hypothetical protein